MKKSKRVILYVSSGLLLLSLVAVAVFNITFYWLSQRDFAVKPRPVTIAYTSEAIWHGQHLAVVKGCNDCHGEDLGGRMMIDNPAVGLITAPNITKGAGGLPADYAEADYIRALRHGLGKDNKSLLIMPAHETSKLTDEDVAALVAYCLQLPRVNRAMPESHFNVMGKALITFGLVPAFAAEGVDHTYIQHRAAVADAEAG